MVLIGIVILLMLYGIVLRLQSGDNSFYLFGIELIPGTQKEAVQEEESAAATETEANSTSEVKWPPKWPRTRFHL